MSFKNFWGKDIEKVFRWIWKYSDIFILYFYFRLGRTSFLIIILN